MQCESVWKGQNQKHDSSARLQSIALLRIPSSPAQLKMSAQANPRPRQRPSRGPSMIMSKDESIDIRTRGLNDSSGHVSSEGLLPFGGSAMLSNLPAALRALLPGRHRAHQLAPSAKAGEKQQTKFAFLSTARDREILALLLPAMLAVFLDPSMGAVDLGTHIFGNITQCLDVCHPARLSYCRMWAKMVCVLQ